MTFISKTRSLRSRCRQGSTPSDGSRGGTLLAASSFWWIQVFLACSCSTLIPVSVVMKWSPYVCLSVFSTSYQDISHIGLERKKEKVKSLSRIRLFATPWTVAYQASPSMGFSRQEYRSGLPFPSPGNLPNPGIKPRSPELQADMSPSESPGKSLLD